MDRLEITLTQENDTCTFLITMPDGKAECSLTLQHGIWIFGLFVTRELRGQGLGGKLIDHVVTWANDNNYGLLGFVDPHYDIGLDENQLWDFYVRHGFKVGFVKDFVAGERYVYIGDVSNYFAKENKKAS